MSSDLHDLIRKDIERIPLPPSEEWTLRRRPRAGHRGLRLAATAIASVLVVIGALTAGQLVRALRDRIEADRAASAAGLVPGEDLVYLADGDPAAQGLQIVAMPQGQSVGRFVGESYVGGALEGGLMTVSGDYAYLPVARSTGTPSDKYESYVQQFDLRRGIPLGRIDTGTVTLPRDLQAALPGTPVFPAATATSPDGQAVWLVVDNGWPVESAAVSRLAVRIPQGSQSPGGSVVASTQLPPGRGPARSRVIALGNDHVAVIVEHFIAGNRVSADWYILDAQLHAIATFAGDDAQRLPVGGLCGDVQPDPTGNGWVVLCSDPSLTANGALVFLDGTTFRVRATVPLDRAMGFALGMIASSDGRITIVTDRPVIARIDARTRSLLDARPVSQRHSWFEQLLPLPAEAKTPGGPSVVFSPDARYAYVAGSPGNWWGPLSTIDLAAATVIATNTSVGSVIGLGLSAGGERLYTLTVDLDGNRTVTLLVPQTLGIARRSATLGNGPFALVTVQPSTLVQLSWEGAVIDAFRAGGLSVRTIGASKDEGALGVLLPARAFIVSSGPASGGLGVGADVIYVKGAGLGAIAVCEVAPSAQGRHAYVTSVGGQRVGSEDAVAPVFHLVSSDYYVIAYDTATRDALQRGLGLAQATCP